jgi:hypothetical protein
MSYYSAAQLKTAHAIQIRIESLQNKLDSLQRKLAGVLGSAQTPGRSGTNKISAAGRARIAAAQRLRWAKFKVKGGKTKTGRTMSPAARAKIARAAKARWAKAKAAGKNRL